MGYTHYSTHSTVGYTHYSTHTTEGYTLLYSLHSGEHTLLCSLYSGVHTLLYSLYSRVIKWFLLLARTIVYSFAYPSPIFLSRSNTSSGSLVKLSSLNLTKTLLSELISLLGYILYEYAGIWPLEVWWHHRQGTFLARWTEDYDGHSTLQYGVPLRRLACVPKACRDNHYVSGIFRILFKQWSCKVNLECDKPKSTPNVNTSNSQLQTIHPE